MGADTATGKFDGIRGAMRDIKLLLTDVVGGGKPDAGQQLILEVFFGMMGYVAKSDRLVTSHESQAANLVMDETDLSLAARAIAMEAFERGAWPPPTASSTAASTRPWPRSPATWGSPPNPWIRGWRCTRSQ